MGVGAFIVTRTQQMFPTTSRSFQYVSIPRDSGKFIPKPLICKVGAGAGLFGKAKTEKNQDSRSLANHKSIQACILCLQCDRTTGELACKFTA